MARPGLTQHRKFRRLEKSLGSHIIARGVLETMWDVAYQNGDPYLGDSDDVEAAAHWNGEGKPGQLTRALLEAGGDSGPGFIEEIPDKPGHYQVHDLFHHAPLYVSGRRARELERRQDKTCAHCRASYHAADPRSRYCTSACRTAAWREGNRDVKGEHNESVTDRDGNSNVTVTDCDTTPAPAPAPAPHIKTKPSCPPSADAGRSKASDIVEIWNQTAEGTKLPRAKLTDKRNNAIRIRLKDPDWFEDFRTACAYIRRTDFYCGRNERGWVPTLDFLLRPDKVTELAERARANGASGSNLGSRELLDISPPKPNPKALEVLEKFDADASRAAAAAGAKC